MLLLLTVHTCHFPAAAPVMTAGLFMFHVKHGMKHSLLSEFFLHTLSILQQSLLLLFSLILMFHVKHAV